MVSLRSNEADAMSAMRAETCFHKNAGILERRKHEKNNHVAPRRSWQTRSTVVRADAWK